MSTPPPKQPGNLPSKNPNSTNPNRPFKPNTQPYSSKNEDEEDEDAAALSENYSDTDNLQEPTEEIVSPRDAIKIGIPIGDINGVGIEVILKTFADDRLLSLCTPVIYGSSRVLSYHRKVLQLPDTPYHPATDALKAKSASHPPARFFTSTPCAPSMPLFTICNKGGYMPLLRRRSIKMLFMIAKHLFTAIPSI